MGRRPPIGKVALRTQVTQQELKSVSASLDN